MEEKKFCEKCGQLIVPGKFLFKKGMEFYEFKDGYYCGPCGKLKVEEARKGK